jgi:hypothetical protein
LIRRGWSAVARPRLESTVFDSRFEVALAAKWPYRPGPWAASVSAGPVWPSDGFGGCAGWKGEGRIALGRGFQLGRDADAFGEIAAGFRYGASACAQSK